MRRRKKYQQNLETILEETENIAGATGEEQSLKPRLDHLAARVRRLLAEEVLLRKQRHYPEPTRLSEEVYAGLLALLLARRQEHFYGQVEGLFRALAEIEAGFELALRRKDQVYQEHNQRMNKIFNQSSSEGDSDYQDLL